MAATMADAAATVLLEQLKLLIIQDADQLRTVQDDVIDIERELQLLAAMVEAYELPNQAPNEQLKQQIKQIRHLIHQTEFLVRTYATIVSERATEGVLKIPIKLLKERNIGKKLRRIRIEIIDARKGLSRNSNPVKEEDLSKRGDQSQVLPPTEGLSTYVDEHQIHVPSHVEEDHLAATSYQSHVPPYLRRFIYYFLLFPDGFEIPTRRLLVLWAAEGLIHPINDDDGWDENIALKNLNSLEDLGLVHLKKKKLNGKVQKCQLKDGIRETWLMEAGKDNFFRRDKRHTHRVVDHTTDADGDSFIRIHGNPTIADSVPKYRNVISFLSFDAKEGSKAGEDIGDFLDKCILARCFLWLKVLDLERVFRPKLPKTMGKLIRLKYLGLRWTYLEQLPVFVNKLLELQVLDVKHTYISVLPKSIWRMKDLRHLYLSEVYRTRFPDWPTVRSSCLEFLRTLWGAFVDEDTCVKDGLDTLVNIRKLALACGPKSSSTSRHSDMSEQLQAVDKWISKLKFLECLRLKSRDRQGKAADLYLTTLSGHTNLSTVYLLGKLKLNPSVVHEFPASLTDVTLSGSELDMDPMEFLGSLPKLQILRLLGQSVVYPRIRFSKGSFLQLKVLYIWKLDNLEEWEVERGAVPRLEELEIRSCEKLTRLPNELQNVNELRKLRLTNMPERFTDQTRAEQPQLWAKIDHGGEDEQKV